MTAPLLFSDAAPRHRRAKSKVFIAGTSDLNADARSVVDLWNQMACRLAKVQGVQLIPVHGLRARHLQGRLNEREFVTRFAEVCQRIEESPFLRGDVCKFTISFDWIIANCERWVAVLENKYAPHNNPTVERDKRGDLPALRRNRLLTAEEKAALS